MMGIAVFSKERAIQAWETEGGALPMRAKPAPVRAGLRSWVLNSSHRDVRTPLASFGSTDAVVKSGQRLGYPKFKNDRGVPEIRIAAREFECIGASPPNDHPHIHIDMGSQDTILCPYCGTRYRMDAALSPALQANPADSLFVDADAAQRPPIDPHASQWRALR